MRKLLILILSVLMALGIAACGGGNTPDSPASSNNSNGGLELPEDPF